MRIGVLTFHRAHNYGAVLQAYAIKQALSQYGTAEVIDYWPRYQRHDYSLFDFRSFEKDLSLRQRAAYLRSGASRLMLLPLRISRYRKFKAFIRANLLSNVRTTPFTRAEELPQGFDIYVYGSDQIWRVYDRSSYPLPDLVYFGSGMAKGKRKLAYAASMGVIDDAPLALPAVRGLLGTFDALSVRESELKEAIERIQGNPVTQVLDPTFLIPREEWLSFTQDQAPGSQRPYLLYYGLIESALSKQIADRLCAELDLALIHVNGFETIKGAYSRSIKQSAGPADFLNWVRHSELVVSSSYHGVVFAIIFQKRFYACGMGQHESRVSSLLKLLNLEERLVRNAEDTNADAVIDWHKLQKTLEPLVLKSKRFIGNSLTQFKVSTQ